MIVPMIRPMYPVCARFPWQAAVVPAISARPGPCSSLASLAGTAPSHGRSRAWSAPGT